MGIDKTRPLHTRPLPLATPLSPPPIVPSLFLPFPSSPRDRNDHQAEASEGCRYGLAPVDAIRCSRLFSLCSQGTRCSRLSAAVASQRESNTSFVNLAEILYSVYRAVNMETRLSAACKVVPLTDETTRDDRRALEREMKIHGALKHRNVLEFIGAYVVEPNIGSSYFPAVYMLLEFAAGGDLFDKIGALTTHKDDATEGLTTRYSS